jgi:hypothetical protein
VTEAAGVLSHACPGCGSASTRRSRRQGVADKLCALWGQYPYRCRECSLRFRLESHSARVAPDKPRLRQTGRAENRRRRRAVQQRELLLYGFALAAFAVVVLFVTADRS